MTLEEFSNEFDTLINGYRETLDFGNDRSIEFDEYEKSVFLTKAQEELVMSLYRGTSVNPAFEVTEENRRMLASLEEATTITEFSKGNGISENSVFAEVDNIMYITYESAVLKDDKLGCKNGTSVAVIPTTQDTYYRISRNPFRKPSDKRVLRLDYGNDTNTSVIELISEYHIDSYYIRYIKKPTPIILVDLGDNLTINGESASTPCKLNSILHRTILTAAVDAAINSIIPKSKNV